MKIRGKEEGFTLVELLAIIVILALIALITYPIVTQTISNSKDKLSDEQYSRIYDAAKAYAVKNVSGDSACVTIATLKASGFLEDKTISDPKTGNTLDGHVSIVWNSSNNQYTYTYGDGSC